MSNTIGFTTAGEALATVLLPLSTDKHLVPYCYRMGMIYRMGILLQNGDKRYNFFFTENVSVATVDIHRKNHTEFLHSDGAL